MSKHKTAKDIKEATKILSYLGRAEKYFDLELVKNGRPVKPLLMIADIIDPLRQISEVAARVESNEPLPHYSAEAFDHADSITSVCDDIITLNPRGLVSSDKATLTRLKANINTIRDKAALDPNFASPAPQPVGLRVVDQYQFPGQLPNQLPVQEQQPNQVSYNYEIPAQTAQNVAAYQSQYQNQYQQPQPQPQYQQSAAQYQTTPAPQPQYFEPEYGIQTAPAPAPAQNYVQTPAEVEQPQPEAKVYQIHPAKRDHVTDNENYLATTYPGINLQEAAEIISELARNPKNHNLILLEHASQIKPIPLAMDIINDLRALAPIADAIENAQEIVNKEPIRILSKAEQIISICNDVASLSVDGLDLRRRKLLSKFIRQDISRLASIARSAYPEAFSPTTDNFGELVTSTLVDFAELLTAKARYHEDRLYAEILALVSYQIAEYANYNELRTKFDVLIKKTRVNSNPKVFDTKIKMAWLRATSYVPQIARHSQEIAVLPQTNEFERRLIEKSLEILQLAYIEARDKYASYLQDFTFLRAA